MEGDSALGRLPKLWPSEIPWVTPSCSTSAPAFGELRGFCRNLPCVCLNPPYSQLRCRKPPVTPWQDGSWSSAASSHHGGSCQCPAQPSMEGDTGSSQAVSGTARCEQPALGLLSTCAWALPRISKCLGDDSMARRPLPDPCCHRSPAATLGLTLEGGEAVPSRGGAVLTSWAVLLHAAPPGLQPRGAGSPILPGSLRHLPYPRLHSPLAAARPALVGAGAPLAPRPRLARLCGDRGRLVTPRRQARPQRRRARGAGAAYLGTRGCRAVPQCRRGTAGNTGPCTSKTCPCTSCRSLC